MAEIPRIPCQLDRETKDVNTQTPFPQKGKGECYRNFFLMSGQSLINIILLGTHYAIAYLKRELREIVDASWQ